MNAYLDASVLLRLLLVERDPLAEWGGIDHPVTSALAEVEVFRTLDRLRLTERALDGATHVKRREAAHRMFEGIEVLELTRSILMRAAQPMPTHLGTLDAIHLVSAQAYWEANEPLRFATHDRALAAAARASGFHVIGV